MSERPIDDVLAEARKKFLGDNPAKEPRQAEQEPDAVDPWLERDGYASLDDALTVMLPRNLAESAAMPIVLPKGMPAQNGITYPNDIRSDAAGLLGLKCDWCGGTGTLTKEEPCSLCKGTGCAPIRMGEQKKQVA